MSNYEVKQEELRRAETLLRGMYAENRPIGELTGAEFLPYRRTHLRYGRTTETFVTTKIGRITYAVSADYGFAYTRPQLLAKYENVGATYTELLPL